MRKWFVGALAGVMVWAGAAMPEAGVTARADDGETGTTVAIGLAVAVAVVYGLMTLRTDIENYAEVQQAIDHATAVAEASPVVVDSVVARSAYGEPRDEGVMVGWRVRF